MVCVYPFVAGNTLKSHEAFLKKLTKRGAKVVDSPEKSKVIIVFCPIVSRYETDIGSALSSAPGKEPNQNLILVAMHHTFDQDYIYPKREQDSCAVTLHVDCLFHEKKGLFKCPCNKNAIKKVRKQLHLGRMPFAKLKKGGKEVRDKKDDSSDDL